MLWSILLACNQSPCPDEMVLVAGGSFCMDRWEGQLQRADGTVLEQVTSETPPDVIVRSVANVFPSRGMRYAEALRACASTPVAGKTGVFKHLATTREWMAAASGLPGVKPAWTSRDDNKLLACNTGEKPGTILLPTGNRTDCRSDAGTFDQVGNLFEWVDSGRRIHITETQETLKNWGIVLTSAAQEWLTTDHCETLATLRAEANALNDRHVQCDNVGRLQTLGSDGQPDSYGYLTLPATPENPEDLLLPVQFLTRSGGGHLRLASELDGEPLPEKIGGSYYMSFPHISMSGSHAHPPSFRGTIGLRCAAPAFK